MKASCIAHPANEPLLIIRKWQIDLTGHACSAALLSFFEYWHNIKLAAVQQARKANSIAEMHGDPPTQSTALYQFHSAEEIEAGLLGLYGRGKIAEEINRLVELGFIEVSRNPNPKYAFDKTRYILFKPEVISDRLKTSNRSLEKEQRSLEKEQRSLEKEHGETDPNEGSDNDLDAGSPPPPQTSSETSFESTPLNPPKGGEVSLEQTSMHLKTGARKKPVNGLEYAAAKELVAYLNASAGRTFDEDCPAILRPVVAVIRKNPKASVPEMEKMIDRQVALWRGTKFEEFLRPSTLFGTKFNEYYDNRNQTTENGQEHDWRHPCQHRADQLGLTTAQVIAKREAEWKANWPEIEKQLATEMDTP